jgi:small-conductance mechanosensitive channel
MSLDVSKAWEKIQTMMDEGIAALPNFVIAIFVFVVFLFLAKGIRAIIRRIVRRIGRGENVGSVLGRLAEATVLLLGLLVAASIVVPSFQAGDIVKLLGVGSVAVGFAFKDIFQNFLAGIIILLTNPFRVGDQIVVEGSKEHEGTVEKIETRATIIKTYDNRRVVIPNSKLFINSVVVNTAYSKRRSSAEIGIGYENDIEKAKKVILKAIKDVEGVEDDPEPSVVTGKLADWTVNLNARWWTDSKRSKVVAAQNDVLAAIKNACDEEGISLPSPIREVHFYDKTERENGDGDSEKKDGAQPERRHQG